jgi:hypothetical protein
MKYYFFGMGSYEFWGRYIAAEIIKHLDLEEEE